MMKNNYKDYDILTLYVKKKKLKEIIKHYQVFGWTLIEEEENKRYEDIVDLTFTRPHKIDNKDELQLQQIYMEERLNKIGKLERHKHARTTSFGLCFGLIILATIIFGLFIALKVNSIYSIVSGSMLAIAGLMAILLEVRLLKRMYVRENVMFEVSCNELEMQIDVITKRVQMLIGGEDEQK